MYYKNVTRAAQSNQQTYAQIGEITSRNLAGCSFNPPGNNIYVRPHVDFIADRETQSNGRCSLATFERGIQRHYLDAFRCDRGAIALVDIPLTNAEIISLDEEGFWLVPLDQSFYILEADVNRVLTALNRKSATFRLIGV